MPIVSNLIKPKLYKTDGGRIVYGGGGITPDIFVPKDTLLNSKYLFELYSKNIIREYALRYANENKKKLEKQSFQRIFDLFPDLRRYVGRNG
jgi:carboxyl-terminal processing protease